LYTESQTATHTLDKSFVYRLKAGIVRAGVQVTFWN